MRRITKFPPALIAILALVFTVSTASVAKEKYSKFPNIKIKNFGQMDDRFYRGARPKEEDYKALAELGITTVIDLTDNSREYEQPPSRPRDSVTSTFRWLIRAIPVLRR